MKHSLMEQFLSRFTKIQQSNISQEFGVKSAIDKVHAGMFCSSYILVNRHPIFDFLLIKYFFGIFWVTISQEIPRRIYKSIHCICFSSGFAVTLRAFGIYPGLICG